MSAADQLEKAREYLAAGRRDAAMTVVRQVLADEPEDLDAMLLTARIVRGGGGSDAAIGLYETILRHHPDSAEAQAGLGACFGLAGRYGEAEASLRRAVAVKPDYFEAWAFLGEALVEQGRTEAAMDCFERSHAIRPYNATVLSKRLFYATFDPRYDAACIADMNRDWGSRVSAAVPAFPDFPKRKSGGRLRIAYLSDEFYERVTARFMAPVLARHDRERFDVTCYARNATADATTEVLSGFVDRWRDLSSLDDRAVAAAIREDGIDILILCTSYRAETRNIMAFRPAPVQVCYSNLVSTTGLAAVDYLITEDATDPAGSEAHYTERLVRLSNRNIYQPPENCPEPGPPPCVASGFVRFASYNNLGKVTPAVVALWSRILKALPGARLAMKSVNRLSDPGARDYFLGLFAAEGIDGGRLDLLGGDADLQTHLRRYREIDIALDPFPCNGGTTSCEALWMGVPVVTMAGDTFMGRQGVNYLGKLELEDLVASTADGYVDAAVRLAGDTERLSSLRAGLRARASERLFDPASHVAELETAYVEMWRRHETGAGAAAFGVRGARVLA